MAENDEDVACQMLNGVKKKKKGGERSGAVSNKKENKKKKLLCVLDVLYRREDPLLSCTSNGH